jgi:hypothetical protein
LGRPMLGKIEGYKPASSKGKCEGAKPAYSK